MSAVRITKLCLFLCLLTTFISSAVAAPTTWNMTSQEHCMASLQAIASNYRTGSGLEDPMPISASLGRTICRDISVKYPLLWIPPVRRPVLGCFAGDCLGGPVLHPIKTVTEPPVHVPDGDNEIILLTFTLAILGLTLWFRQRRFA